MTVRLVALSATPLLVPGAAGAADVLADYRAAVLDVLGDVVKAPTVVVVARGTSTRRGPFRASLGAAGIDDGRLGWSDGAPGPADATARALAGPPASVGVLAVRAVGWTGPIEVVEVSPQEPVAFLTDLGRRLWRSGAGLVVAEDPGPQGGSGNLGDPARVVRDAALAGRSGRVRGFVGEYESRRYDLVAW